MESFSYFRAPQVTIYGKDSFSRLGAETAQRGKKALIVSDRIMQEIGNVSSCIAQLDKVGVDYTVYTGVASEPTDIYVGEALHLFVDHKCDVIISLGGGSCIDTAKAVAVLATNGGYIGDYRGGNKFVQSNPIPHIAVPTTAGTGSEVTDVTVITNTMTDEKMMIKQPAIMPTVAIVDPMLTISTPKRVTAATGVDALSHAIEAYLSKKAQLLTDSLALLAIKLISNHLIRAFENAEDLEAREAMSIGSMYAGMAFSNASVGLVHGMSRPIGALFHVPHGESNAMLLPAVLEFSESDCKERLAEIGRAFEGNQNVNDEEYAKFAVNQVRKLCLDLGIPNLRNWGIEQEMFEDALSKMASDALLSGSPANNPKVPTKEEIEELYKVCFDYQFH